MSQAISFSLKPRALGTAPLGLLLATPLFLLPLGGWLVDSSTMTLAQCGFKVLFGIPCMGCGATRGTLNMLHGDWLEAFTFQPLIVTAYVGFAIWGVISFVTYLMGKELEIEMATWLTWTTRALLLIAPFANWAYLIGRDI